MTNLNNPKMVLFIEPPLSEKLSEPINDELVKMMEYAIKEAPTGCLFGDGFRFDISTRGVHRTACGEVSKSFDFLLENGMVTNSLAPFYLKWYRYSIPESEMEKVNKIYDYYTKELGLKF